MLLRCGWNVGSTCFRQSLKVHPCLIGHSPLRLLSTSEDGLTMLQRRNLNAQKWLEKLSPEMELKKKRIDFELQTLQDQGRFQDYEIQSADMKYILTECETPNSLKRYLDFQRKNSEKQKKRTKEKTSHKARTYVNIDPDEYSVFSYTLPHYNQKDRFFNHKGLMSLLNDTVPIVFDMDFDMSRREEIRAIEQVTQCISKIKKCIEPCQLHVTSCMNNSYLSEKMEEGKIQNSCVELHEEPFEELFPRENLVYLSPDAPELRHHIPGDIYVIGGIVDLKSHRPLTLEKARGMGIRCGSFPFMKHGLSPSAMKACFGEVLTLNKVVEVLLNINLKRQWNYVMNDYLREYGIERKRKAKRNQKTIL